MLQLQHFEHFNPWLLLASHQRYRLKMQKPRKTVAFFVFLAVRTGLEPATLGVTGRYSNQTELPHQAVKCDAKIAEIFLLQNVFMKKRVATKNKQINQT
jgi:hypothetical protein